MKITKHETLEQVQAKPRNERQPANGYFNGCETLHVELEPDKMQTIACRLPDGKFVTFAFVPSPSSPNGFECVDIHATIQPNGMNGETPIYKHHALGFNPGSTTFDTRKIEGKDISLLALLLAPRHYTKN
jgi:hypothetical protein